MGRNIHSVIVKGCLFYDNGNIHTPIPAEIATNYSEFAALLDDLNYLIEKGKTESGPTLSGYLLYEVSA